MCINLHENGVDNRKSMAAYTNRKKQTSSVNCGFMNQWENEKQYWCTIMKRVVEVIKFLASRGMAFRGDIETIGSKFSGNFLGTLELLNKFDTRLEQR